MSRPVPGQRSDYSVFEPVDMRWADMDIYGHMNNAVYYQLFDTVVGRFETRSGLLDPARSPTIFLVVASHCDYFEEVNFGDALDVGLRIRRLGTSSVTYDLSLFRNESSTAAATGGFTHVHVDRETRRPAPIPASSREMFAPLL